ncbi:MAG: response regulator [Deltaproteobacteria bacterium]|jgi:putative two-component system response regulator|nr:response regulator [Deltaproteobacteria bacterium]
MKVPQSSPKGQAGQGIPLPKVLVVDDNLANLSYIGSQLSSQYGVLMAKSGQQALAIASRNQPDLILLDIDMPGMDGFETMARLQDSDSLRRIPVIYLTANHDLEIELKGLDSGAKDFVTKPFQRDIIIHRINLQLRMAKYQHLLEETVKELEDSMVASFSGLIECRDGNTGGHVLRTKRYVSILGGLAIDKGLFPDSLNTRELGLMARAAPLHDIGKIGISDDILLKEGRFHDDEFEMMKRHTTIGAEIIDHMYRKAPTQHYLAYGKKIALSHHEMYNGQGYPEGLAGEDIPLCSRILAVADVYDALVEERIYRPALSHKSAVRIIRDGRGTIFDPVLVDVFLDNDSLFASKDRGGRKVLQAFQ